MKTFTMALTTAAFLLLTACGKDEPHEAAAPAATPAPSTAPAATTEPAPAPMTEAKESVAAAADGATRYIDHAQDEVEFALKRSLAGLEALREDISDSDEVAAIDAKIEEIKAKLANM